MTGATGVVSSVERYGKEHVRIGREDRQGQRQDERSVWSALEGLSIETDILIKYARRVAWIAKIVGDQYM